MSFPFERSSSSPSDRKRTRLSARRPGAATRVPRPSASSVGQVGPPTRAPGGVGGGLRSPRHRVRKASSSSAAPTASGSTMTPRRATPALLSYGRTCSLCSVSPSSSCSLISLAAGACRMARRADRPITARRERKRPRPTAEPSSFRSHVLDRGERHDLFERCVLESVRPRHRFVRDLALDNVHAPGKCGVVGDRAAQPLVCDRLDVGQRGVVKALVDVIGTAPGMFATQ